MGGKRSLWAIFGITALFAVVLCGLFVRNEARYAHMERLSAGTAVTGEGHEVRTGQIDLNAADERTLQLLPGIGPVRAQAIVSWREEHGPFQVVEDVMSVDGIGEKILADIRPYVTVVTPAAEEGGT